MKILSETKSFGGTQGAYTHVSKVTNCEMTFAVYLPPQAKHGKVPVIWYLSGLTCTHENAMTKAGAQAHAADYGVAVIFPDTSPRGDDVANDDAYDLGQGAGFYVNATQTPWAKHFQMWDYVTSELPDLVFENFPLERDRQAITGHSMGGHGALTIAMTMPKTYKSVSAFAPIANPVASDWGRKQMMAYLGADEVTWTAHDASLLLADKGHPSTILVDQGTSDNFLDLLRPEALSQAMAAKRQAGVFRMQEGYDHGYDFVSSFMRDHIEFHAEMLYALE